MNTLQRQPRLFRLVRHTTPTAILAEGVEWSDGATTVRWRGPWPGTSTWDAGVPALLATHGTNGRTQLHWSTPTVPADPAPTGTAAPPTPPTGIAGPPAPPAARQERTTIVGATTVWLPAPAPDGRCSQCGREWPCFTCGP
ncbi:hypothetical protein GCM10009804_70030 [Kribbella hippodromi]|uniref:Uncharacterized protein n=1 Tax=Kribbella hippodromi TaxID=434347 RepID=A0ABP4Q7Y1_9ACTN